MILDFRLCNKNLKSKIWNLKLLEPFFSFEVEEHGDGDDHHDAPEDKVGVVVFEFWDIVEVHSVDSGDKGERDEDRGEDG